MSLRTFAAFLARRRWPEPADNPAQHLPTVVSDSTERVRTERKPIMLVRNKQTGQTAYAKNSDEQIHTLVKLGVLEYVTEEQSKPAVPQARWSVGTSRFGDKIVLWLLTPCGERSPFTGEPKEAEAFFAPSYANCLPIPADVLQRYEAARNKEVAVTNATQAAKSAQRPVQAAVQQHWRYPSNY